MAGPIARCPNGHLFEARGLFNVTGQATVEFRDIAVECPLCPPVNGQRVVAHVIDGSYTFEGSPEGGFIRSLMVAVTANPEDVAALLRALSERPSAPTADEIDEAFADLDPEVAAWFRRIVATMPWARARKLLAYLAPIIVSWYLSHGTDQHLAKTDERVQQLDQHIEQVIEDWEKSHVIPTTTTTSGRVTPKGTVPRASGKRKRPPKPPKRRK